MALTKRLEKIEVILAPNGRASANQLLKLIDYKLIKENSKIFCGWSDITELTNVIYTKTNLEEIEKSSFERIAHAGKGYILFDHR